VEVGDDRLPHREVAGHPALDGEDLARLRRVDEEVDELQRGLGVRGGRGDRPVHRGLVPQLRIGGGAGHRRRAHHDDAALDRGIVRDHLVRPGDGHRELPVAKSDWSRDCAASSTETEAPGPASVSWIRCANSSSEVAVAASKPGPPSLYWSWPFCRTHTWKRAWTVPIWLMPQVPSGEFSVIWTAMSMRSSKVHVVSSGRSTPASSNRAGMTRMVAAFRPALIATSPSSGSSPTSTDPSTNSEVSRPASARFSSAPRPPYSAMYFSSIWMTSGVSPPAVWVASLSQ